MKNILAKEILNPKHRWFVWTIVIIVLAGIALTAYVLIFNLNLESEFF